MTERFDIDARGNARVNAIGKIDANEVNFGNRSYSNAQQQVSVLGLDTFVPFVKLEKWIDRVQPQAELSQRLETRACLVELVGQGGFGKSSIAAWLYERERKKFDKALWINFRKVPTFNQFARWVLQEIGFLVDPQASDEQLVRELAYRLIHCCCLLVMDQLEAVQHEADAKSYETFLQTWQQHGRTSMVLVTTRQAFLTEGKERLNLTGLAAQEGETLLRQRHGIIEDTENGLLRLVEIAEGHPLLLNLAASWLKQETQRRLSESDLGFFERLFRNYQGDLEAKVGEIFAELFAALPERSQRLLLRVVVYRNPFGLEMAQAIVADAEIEDLQMLEDRAFLQLLDSQRWMLHPLMRRSVRQKAQESGQEQEAHERAIAYFTANIKPSAETIEDCAETLEVFHHCCELGQYAQAYQIMSTCVDFLERRGYYNDLVPIYERLTAEWRASDLEEQRNLGWAWTRLGNLYNSVGQYEGARSAYETAQAHFDKLNFSQGKVASLGGLGNAYFALGQCQQAINFLQQSLKIAHQIGDRRGEGSSLGSLGNAYRLLGQYQQAINFLLQSLKIAYQIGDRQGEAISLGNLGAVYQSLGQYQQAINFLQQSLEIKRQIGDRRGEAITLGNLGAVYQSLGQYQQAINFLQQSLEVAHQIGDRQGEVISLGNLGAVYRSLGQHQRAINFLQQSLKIAHQIGDRWSEGSSLVNLGNVYQSLEQYQGAINFHQQSLEINRQIGDRPREAISLGNLGNVYQSLGQYQRAINFHQQSLEIKREIGNQQGEAISLWTLNSLYQLQGQFKRARIYRHQAYRLWKELQLPLEALPLPEFQKRMCRYLGDDWIEQQLENEQKLAWLANAIGLIVLSIRWIFSPLRWIQKRLKMKEKNV